MKTSAQLILLALFLPLLAGACSSEPLPTRSVSPSVQLSPGAEPNTMRYVNPNVDLMRYKRFMIDPVTIYNGPDATFGDVSMADRQEIADFMQQEFRRTLSQHYQIVTTPGPDVLRIHLTLAGIQETRPALATATHLVPLGLAMNVVKGGAGGQGSFMGSVTMAMDFYDSLSNEIVASVVTMQHPNAMDVSSVVTGMGAAKAGVTDGAEKLAAAIDKIQRTGQVPKAR